MKRWTAFICLSLLVTLSIGAISCTGVVKTTSNYNSTTTPPSGEVRLLSITITPATPSPLSVGSTQEFRAIGKYSDGSTKDITSQATWTSKNPSVASVGGGSAVKSIAFANSAGTTQIIAALVGITSSEVTLTVPSSSLADSVLIYLDSNYGTLWDSTNQPDLSKLQWTTDNNETGSPYSWEQATLTVYLWNKNASTIAVDAEDNPNAMYPGFSIHSDTITIKAGERSPLNIIIEESADVLGGASTSSFNLWFNIRKAN